MKTENTLDNYKKFVYSTCWGQWVDFTKDNHTTTTVISSEHIGIADNLINQGYKINRTSLSDISDEDAIEVAKIEGVPVYGAVIKNIQPFKRGLSFNSSVRGVLYQYSEDIVEILFDEYKFYKEIRKRAKHSSLHGNTTIYRPVAITDFLRSKGYLIGWMDLTPQDLIDYGWVKTKNTKS